jgi:serine/threonine protein kinase
MGKVYLAWDPDLRQDVVVKMPKLSGPQAEQFHFRDRFLREARLAAQVRHLKHPHLCAVFDCGVHEGQPFVVMEYVPGQSLAQKLAGRQRFEDVRAAAEIARQVADALLAVHQQGIVHRDLKLGNILLDLQGRAVLTDFGLARSPDDEPLTTAGMRLGTAAYMAWEQAACRHEQVDGRTDVCGLGLVLYRMLTGKPAHEGTREEVLARIAGGTPPPPPSQHRPDLDKGLEAIVLKAIACRPEDRYQSAAELRDALAAWLGPSTPAPLLGAGLTTPPSLEGLDLRIWNDVEPGRRNLSIREPGALPLRSGDRIRVRVRRQRPAYLYLLWIDASGQAGPLYPWKPGRWEERPPNEDSIAELEWPRYAAGQGLQGMPIQPPGGLETLLVLARDEPLATDFDLRERLEGFPGELRLDDPARLVEWLDQGEQGGSTRMALGWDTEPITDPETEIREFVRDRLGSFFTSVQGFSFTTRH